MSTMIVERLDETPGAGRLGRHVEHDPRSRGFAIEEAPAKAAKAVLWHRWSPILNQGGLGSCTGHALAGLFGTEPFACSGQEASPFGMDFAVHLYELATGLDRIEGSWPPDDTGSTGNAVAKAGRQLGCLTSWSWAFSPAGLIRALQDGPVIVGAPWMSGFDKPDRGGYIRFSGRVRGGHEWLVRGYDPQTDSFTADNSWGTNWSLNGSFRFTSATWQKLAGRQADVTIPVR